MRHVAHDYEDKGDRCPSIIKIRSRLDIFLEMMRFTPLPLRQGCGILDPFTSAPHSGHQGSKSRQGQNFSSFKLCLHLRPDRQD